MFRQFRDRLDSAPLAIRFLVCAALLKFLCSGFYLSWFTNGSDFTLVHQAGSRAVTGQGTHVYDEFLAYKPDNDNTLFFMYPPPVALFYTPLGMMPFRAALTIFELLAQAALLAAFFIWARHRKIEPFSEAYYLAGAMLLLFFPVDFALQLGQNDTFVLLLIVSALACQKRPILFGLVLAAAIWLKVFLGFLLLYLLLRRRWSLLLSTLFWLGALAGASLAFIPWQSQLQYFSQLGRDLGIEAFYDNQTLTGFFYRLLTYSGYTHGIADAPGLARSLTLLAGLLLTGGFAAVVLSGDGEDFEGGFGLALITALLLSPHSDTHHQVLLLIPFLILLGRPPVRSTTLLYYGFFAAFMPVIAFRFLAQDRLVFFADGFKSLAYSIPVLVLLGFWRHYAAALGGGLKALGSSPARRR
jgi:hypothetical protein